MKFSRKKFIYLISPSKIHKSFENDLIEVLRQKKVSFFQLRLKNTSLQKKIKIGKKIQRICKKFKVKFLINDNPWLAKKLDADGCHLGQKDTDIVSARKILSKKKLGTLIVQNKKKQTIGIITDGQIRRFNKKTQNLHLMSVKEIMTKNPISIEKKDLAAKALSLMNSKKITSLCVFRKGKRNLYSII